MAGPRINSKRVMPRTAPTAVRISQLHSSSSQDTMSLGAVIDYIERGGPFAQTSLTRTGTKSTASTSSGARTTNANDANSPTTKLQLLWTALSSGKPATKSVFSSPLSRFNKRKPGPTTSEQTRPPSNGYASHRGGFLEEQQEIPPPPPPPLAAASRFLGSIMDGTVDGDDDCTWQNDDGTIQTYSDTDEEGRHPDDTVLGTDDGTRTLTCGEGTGTVYSESACTYESITGIGILMSRWRRFFLSKRNHKIVVDMIPIMLGGGPGSETQRQRNYREFLENEGILSTKRVNFAYPTGCCHTGSGRIDGASDDDDDIVQDDNVDSRRSDVAVPASVSRGNPNDVHVNDDHESIHDSLAESFLGSIIECCSTTSAEYNQSDDRSIFDMATVSTNRMQNKSSSSTKHDPTILPSFFMISTSGQGKGRTKFWNDTREATKYDLTGLRCRMLPLNCDNWNVCNDYCITGQEEEQHGGSREGIVLAKRDPHHRRSSVRHEKVELVLGTLSSSFPNADSRNGSICEDDHTGIGGSLVGSKQSVRSSGNGNERLSSTRSKASVSDSSYGTGPVGVASFREKQYLFYQADTVWSSTMAEI